MLAIDYSQPPVCDRMVTLQEAFEMRLRAVGSWAGSLVIVGLAIWTWGLRGGALARDRQIMWGVFGLWKLVALGFALSIGVPCWESYGRPVSVTGPSWEGLAMMLTLAMWAVMVVSLAVLLVAGR